MNKFRSDEEEEKAIIPLCSSPVGVSPTKMRRHSFFWTNHLLLLRPQWRNCVRPTLWLIYDSRQQEYCGWSLRNSFEFVYLFCKGQFNCKTSQVPAMRGDVMGERELNCWRAATKLLSKACDWLKWCFEIERDCNMKRENNTLMEIISQRSSCGTHN